MIFTQHMGCLGLCLWVTLLPVRAEDLSSDLPVTFEEYATHVLRHHPGLRARWTRSQAARDRIRQAGTLPDPQVGVTRFGESVQTRTGPQETVFSLNQRFPWFGTLDRRTEVARAEARAEAFAAQTAELELIRNLATVYFEFAYTFKAIELTGENLDLLRNLEPIVESKVEGGGELNELLRLKVEIGKLTDTLADHRRTRGLLEARLKSVLNLDAARQLDAPSWSAPDWVESEERTLSSHTPELLQLREKSNAARGRVRLADLSAYPELMVGANYIQVGDSEVNPTTPDAGRDPWNVMVGVSIPLWRGNIKAQQAEARAQEREVTQSLDQKRNDLRAELEFAEIGRKDAHRRMELYGSELLGLAEQAVEISRVAYQGNRTGILEVIDSERTLLELHLRYWLAAADAHVHRITLETLTLPSLNEATRTPVAP
jgi:outer membrane protein TolC